MSQCAAILLLALLPLQGWAGSLWEGREGWHDLRGEVRLVGIYRDNPDQPLLFGESTTQGLSGIARLLLDGGAGEQLSYSFNLYQTFIPANLTQAGVEVERSSLLEHAWEEENYTHLAVDQLYASYHASALDLHIGRQPINLATTLYFSPNDLFAPFDAATFYRIYKPGVDALRLDYELAGLSRMSLIHVLGFQPTPESDTGWSTAADHQRSSTLWNLNYLWQEIEWSLLVGQHQHAKLMALALQTELGGSGIGLRMEANQQQHDATVAQYSAGLDYQWPNSLQLRAEYYANNSGASSRHQYPQTPLQATTTPLANRYLALGLGYELTPLAHLDLTLLRNMVDGGALLAANISYSMADESDLSLAITRPFPHAEPSYPLQSEYSLLPTTITLEVRYGF